MENSLYQEVKKVVIKKRKASASFFQREFKIDYFQAARFIDMLEEEGIVGKANASKPREILI